MKRKLLLSLYIIASVFAWLVTYKLNAESSYFEFFIGASSFILGSISLLFLVVDISWSAMEEYKKRFPN